MNKVAIADAYDYEIESVKYAMAELFESLGLDDSNPLKDVVTPGDTVFIKPNWVASRWRRRHGRIRMIMSISRCRAKARSSLEIILLSTPISRN